MRMRASVSGLQVKLGLPVSEQRRQHEREMRGQSRRKRDGESRVPSSTEAVVEAGIHEPLGLWEPMIPGDSVALRP